MYRDQAGWIKVYEEKNALWIHNGDPKRPHALLMGEKHSNGFFNSRLVIPDEVLLREAASDLLELFVQQGGELLKIHGVVGPQSGATKLAEFLCDLIIAQTQGKCFWASPAKDLNEGRKTMVFSTEDLNRLPEQSILLDEDVLTTGGSVNLTADAVTSASGNVLPFILVLVNRSGLKEVNDKKIIALIDHPMPAWDATDCPLCQNGSEVIRPKDNWARLVAN